MTKEIKYTVNENGCHICTSHTKNAGGYPRITRNGERWLLSRYIYTQHYGKIPKNKVIMHSCDNPACINIEHLSLGTHYENSQDMINKGRYVYHGNKWKSYVEIDVTFIKELRISKGISQKWLAEKIGITVQYLWGIETGRKRPSQEIFDEIIKILGR